jgi:hypothetical protein
MELARVGLGVLGGKTVEAIESVKGASAEKENARFHDRLSEAPCEVHLFHTHKKLYASPVLCQGTTLVVPLVP